MSAAQMRELQRHVAQPLVACQLEMSLGRRDWIERDLAINDDGPSVGFPDGTLQYCREQDVQLQAWAPLARGLYSGAIAGRRDARHSVARRSSCRDWLPTRGTSREAIVLAWLLRHPADIRPVIGTADPEQDPGVRGRDAAGRTHDPPRLVRVAVGSPRSRSALTS